MVNMHFYSQIYTMYFTDQLNKTIELKNYPKRIISIVPSQSELLWELGVRIELIGITKFCIHPLEMHQKIDKVGGTKNLNIDKIRALKPDLIIGNKEENEKSQIELLEKEFNVWMSDINTFDDSLEMISLIGQLTNKTTEAEKIRNNIINEFNFLPNLNFNALYFIWKNPYMVAGNATFIGDLLHKLKLNNCIIDKNSRYPELTLNEIIKLNPSLILLSSEPYPFKQKDIEELKENLPNTKFWLVDGEMFSWYGSRLQYCAKYFNNLLNPKYALENF